jgi:hypothetical protein
VHFPLTHLWFLYQLLLIYVGVLACAPSSRASIPRRTAHARRQAVDVSIRTMPACSSRIAARCRAHVAADLVLLAGHPDPDQSLIPQMPASVGFGTAFVFGWLVHRSKRCAAGHRAALVT